MKRKPQTKGKQASATQAKSLEEISMKSLCRVRGKENALRKMNFYKKFTDCRLGSPGFSQRVELESQILTLEDSLKSLKSKEQTMLSCFSSDLNPRISKAIEKLWYEISNLKG